MPDSNLFTKYTDAITALKPTNLSSTSQFPESLFIDSNQQLSTWYSPFDYIVNGAQKPPIHGCKSQLPSQKIIRI